MPVPALSRGIPYRFFDGDSTAAPVNSAGVYVPQAGNYDLRDFSWRTDFGVDPSAVNIVIQGAINDVDAEYVTLDTSTSLTGETRIVSQKSFNFLRARVVSRTGGSGVIVEVLV